jgi:hypothetical protein
MKCIVCLQKISRKYIVKPVCRCTIKQPVCKNCYNITNKKLKIVCTVCMTKSDTVDVNSMIRNNWLHNCIIDEIELVRTPKPFDHSWLRIICAIFELLYKLIILLPILAIVVLSLKVIYAESLREKISTFFIIVTLVGILLIEKLK